MFGRKPVVNRNDACLREIRQSPADLIMAIKITNHPTATMHIDKAGQGSFGIGAKAAIAAQAYLAGRSGAFQIFNQRHLRRVWLHHAAGSGGNLPRFGGGEGIESRALGFLDQIENMLRACIKCHEPSPYSAAAAGRSAPPK